MGGVTLGAVVGEVEFAGGPEKSELALGFSAAEPVEFHVHGFCFARDAGFFGHADCCGVVALDGSWGMGPSHFGEGLTERDHFFGYKEETSKFCLGC